MPERLLTSGSFPGRALFRSLGFQIPGEANRKKLSPYIHMGYRLPHLGPRALAFKRMEKIDMKRVKAWKQGGKDEALFEEIVGDLVKLFYAWQPVVPKGWIISFPPSGVSGARDLEYRTAQIANSLALSIGLEVRELFRRGEDKKRHGKHASLEAAPFEILGYCQNPVLVVDDLATSGGTMARCLDACRNADISAWGLVWATF